MSVRTLAWLGVGALACAGALGCSDSGGPDGSGGATTGSTTGSGASTSSAGGAGPSTVGSGGGASTAGSGGGGACTDVTTAWSTLTTAPSSGEYALHLYAKSASHTSWRESGNEALVLDVATSTRDVGQLVLHQGFDGFDYGMAIGALDAGEELRVRVSDLSASAATKSACVGPAELDESAALGNASEGLLHAPIFRWPAQKRFDDLPAMLGWSKSKKHYQAFYTNENGGTVEQCGGGADGIQAEIARWGRASDIERMFNYGPADPTWERCTGSTAFSAVQPRMEGAHPVLYYGDGHNRLFESRAGYGSACGTGGPEQADGDLEGWNTNNPGNAMALDDGLVITLRPLPVALDAVGYAGLSGLREHAVDVYAPWLYRLTDAEIVREGKVDGTKVQPMQNYLYVDVHVNDVGGSGDSYCSFMVSSGFKLRAHLTGNVVVSGPQMTADYFGGQDNVKRIAFPLGAAYEPADLTGIELDAYDGDGMYFLELRDAFIPKPLGENGATLAMVHTGTTVVDRYVDDDGSSCTNGNNPGGPSPPYPCVGGSTIVPVP